MLFYLLFLPFFANFECMYVPLKMQFSQFYYNSKFDESNSIKFSDTIERTKHVYIIHKCYENGNRFISYLWDRFQKNFRLN
jgi:hypothetical protein